MVGTPLPSHKGKCLEYFELFVRSEGLPSSSSKTPISLIRTSSEAQKASVEGNSPPQDSTPLSPNIKGHQVVEEEGEPSQIPHKGSSSLPPQSVPVLEELMEVSFKGIPIKITRDSWAMLSVAIPDLAGNSKVDPLSSKASPQVVVSSSSDSLEGASSSAPPPGFEHVKRSSKKKSSKRMLACLPHRKHLSIMKRSFPQGSKGKSPSSSSSLPISSSSLDKLHDITINCAI
ncbi:uncharacterized protein A4U43_C05F7760 [Asparagus officinalis]|uniref:Uncharacterized protein n=1 Tax=Asparagus officinalis TaxID=4686 RepID=A0A5P1EVJ1_ASPOF|nr:uncharacterized protein A4U43_C05F7760 [Asparagus officinalis]